MNKKILLPFIILLGWLIPGAAHWMLNSRVKGYIIFSLTCLTLAIGLLLSDFRTLRFMDNHFYYLGQFGCGLVFLANLFLTGGHPLGVISLPYFEIGLLYTCVAGTLNLVLLLSLFQPAPEPALRPSGGEGGQVRPADKSDSPSTGEESK